MALTVPLQLDKSITIGVSAYGNLENTRVCLQAILHSAQGDYELILVDDCSPDNGDITQLYLETAKLHSNTQVFSFTKNHEYSGSLNCILSHATGDYVIFISNDIYVTPYYLDALLAVAAKESVGIVRGVSNFVDNGKTSHNIAVDQKITNLNGVIDFSKHIYEKNSYQFFKEDYLTGDAFLTKRSVISKIGTFDPFFYGYFADHDYGIRAARAGFELAVAEGAFAFHNEGSNMNYLDKAKREQKIQVRWAKVHENWARFKLKYSLPIEQLYPGMAAIDWSTLNQPTATDTYVHPKDYSAYRRAVP